MISLLSTTLNESFFQLFFSLGHMASSFYGFCPISSAPARFLGTLTCYIPWLAHFLRPSPGFWADDVVFTLILPRNHRLRRIFGHINLLYTSACPFSSALASFLDIRHLLFPASAQDPRPQKRKDRIPCNKHGFLSLVIELSCILYAGSPRFSIKS